MREAGNFLNSILSGHTISEIRKVKTEEIEKNQNHLDKSWLVSLTIIFISHLSDLTFYDGKISIIFAALFAGLKNISDEDNIEIKNFKLS